MYIHKLALIVVFFGTIRCDKKIKKFKNREVFLSADLDRNLMKSLEDMCLSVSDVFFGTIRCDKKIKKFK